MNSWDNTDTREKTEINSTPSPDNNAWESNKQELPSQVQDQPLHAAGTSIDIPPPVEPVVEERKRPSVARLLLRVWQFFAAIGAFGFQVGATPFSNEPMPFSKPDLLYYGYTICWLSIIWSSFNIFVYMSRRFGNGNKIKKFISTLFDLVLTGLFGVCVFYEIATYRCKPGMHNGWCDFYNTGLFFLMSLFFTYTIHALWNIFGAMTCLRR